MPVANILNGKQLKDFIDESFSLSNKNFSSQNEIKQFSKLKLWKFNLICDHEIFADAVSSSLHDILNH